MRKKKTAGHPKFLVPKMAIFWAWLTTHYRLNFQHPLGPPGVQGRSAAHFLSLYPFIQLKMMFLLPGNGANLPLAPLLFHLYLYWKWPKNQTVILYCQIFGSKSTMYVTNITAIYVIPKLSL